MEEIGRLLRETREKLGLTLEEVERATRIRARYLEAMERGEFSLLPSSVQARGFLHNYSDYLGLDSDDILLSYADHLRGGSVPGSPLVRPQEPGQSSSAVQVQKPRWITTDLLVAMGIILAVLVVLVWGGSRLVLAVQEEAGQSTEQAAGLNLISTASPTLAPTATDQPSQLGLDVLPGEAEIPAADSTLPPELTGEEELQGGVNLRLLIEKRSYLEIYVDGEETFRGRVAPGDIVEYRAEQIARVVTGNGGGVRVVYNGQDQGRLGDIGEVVTRLWDLNGAITPTPTPSQTPTPTEAVTATPNPTATFLP